MTWRTHFPHHDNSRRRAFLPRLVKGKGKLAGWEILSLHGSRPGERSMYLRRPRPLKRDGTASSVVTMPYRKVRTV